MRLQKLAIAAFLMTAATKTFAATVGGIINVDTTWDVTNEPYTISSPVQVAPGVTLTINPGVTVSGGDINVFGTLDAIGASGSSINFNGTHIKPGENSVSRDQPFSINIQHSNISAGSLYYPTGNAIYGSLNLLDSVLTDIPYMYLWYPVADSYIERNTFVNSGGISAGLNNVDLYIKNNAFIDQTTGYAVRNWAAYGTSNQIVEFNSFLSQDRIALALQYDSSAMSGINNYWGTLDQAVIENMIWDRNDDLTLPGYIDYQPFLTAPHPSTHAVPVPAAAWLFLSGLLSLVGVARARQ
jgi:hypothetical protein